MSFQDFTFIFYPIALTISSIFLLATIWEPGYEKQVVSRARRIGATGPVVVDQLLMRGTAEEDLDALSRSGAAKDDADRVARVLTGLRLLRPPAAELPDSRLSVPSTGRT